MVDDSAPSRFCFFWGEKSSWDEKLRVRDDARMLFLS